MLIHVLFSFIVLCGLIVTTLQCKWPSGPFDFIKYINKRCLDYGGKYRYIR